jgi:17beta-estradiol 17-dehydrogenase / very-long-chain 3-oxoacyl-CoA reductase
LFNEQDAQDQEDLVNVNIHATMNVTREVLPKIIENGRGTILNLSSYMGKFPTPLYSIYSGTKAFIDAWSVALRGELKSKKIEVLSLAPMYVQSNMTQIRRTSLTVISPRKNAADTIKQLGAPMLPATFAPYYIHELTMFVYGLVPQGLLLSKSKQAMEVVRKKMLAKKSAQK